MGGRGHDVHDDYDEKGGGESFNGNQQKSKFPSQVYCSPR